jgi:hypothetical protein
MLPLMILFNRKPNEKARSWINPAAMMSDSNSYSSLEDSEILSNSTNLIEKENFDQLVQSQESDWWYTLWLPKNSSNKAYSEHKIKF